MPERSRNRYTADWVHAVLREDSQIGGRDANSLRSLYQGLRQVHIEGFYPRVAESMNTWLEVDQSGAESNPDFWPAWKDQAIKAFRPEGGK